MGGKWSPPPNLPVRPGAYVNFESSGATPIAPGDFGRVGIPVKASWGPDNEFVDLVTDADRRRAFGPVDGYDNKVSAAPASTNTSWLIAEAIRGGAELVKAYRMVGAGAAEASVVLDDFLGKDTLTLTAKYKGTRANGFTVKVAASPIFSGKNVLTILEGGVELEEWLYPVDDIPALIADLNDPVNGSILVEGSYPAGANPEVSEVATLTLGGTGMVAGDKFKLTINFGDNSTAQATAFIVDTDGVTQIQTAVDAALTAGGYAAGDIVVALTAAGPTLATANTVFSLTAAAGLANQNISVTVTSPTGTVPVAGVTTQGARSPLNYGSFVMAGGLNGAAVALSDYSTALENFEAEGGFDLLALDGVSDDASGLETSNAFTGLNSALGTWAANNNEAGRYVMVVTGGGANELANAGGVGLTAALARSAAFDSEWVVNIGVSGLDVTSPGGNVLNLTSAQAAARVAGMIANAGITGSVTFGAVEGVDSVNGPITPAQIDQCIQQGVLVFAKRGDAVRIEDGITSFISLTDEKDFTFTQIRAVRAIQQIGLDITEIVERDWIGKKINTTTVRDSLVATLQQYFAALEARNVLVNGTQVQIDARYDNTKTNVFVLVLAQFQFELKRVLLTVRVPTVS